MIKYIGSKRALLPHLLGAVGKLPDVENVLDAFSGTARVGHALKGAGYKVTSNDHLSYAHMLARCYVESDRDLLIEEATRVINELDALVGKAGWFTQMFCVDSRYFQPDNGARVDVIRERIATLDLSPQLEAIALVSLMEAADRVDSTCGVQMAYLKRWAKRSDNRLTMRVPQLLQGAGRAWKLEADEAVANEHFDLIYLDPPYNQHKYMGNYHVWETLMRWDEPTTYGVANKRIDCREYKSPFNSKPGIKPAVERLISSAKCRYLMVSFNNEGNLSQETLRDLLRARGEVEEIIIEHPRYVGARIGIHNPQGQRVGEVSHVKNNEHLYIVRVDTPPTILNAEPQGPP